MKIVTWNINGLRTFKGILRTTLDSFNADVICVQETKTNRSSLEEDLACVPGYNSYFAFPRTVSGYSGVATFSSDAARPFSVNESLLGCECDGIEGMDALVDVTDPFDESAFLSQKELSNVDSEGRTMASLYKFCDSKSDQLKNMIIFNLYCPRNDPERPERAQFKQNFNALLEHQAKSLVRKGFHVILAGDMNVSHKRIDNCEPDEVFDEAPERIWLSELLNSDNDVYFVDAFRHFHPDAVEQYTCWNSQKSARVTNFGTRIDYIICDSGLIEYFKRCDIHSDILGSDHCPVSAVLDISLVSHKKILKKCTKNWPEFTGKQISLSSFLVKRPKPCGESTSDIVVKKRGFNATGGQATLSSFFSKRTKIDKSAHMNDNEVPSTASTPVPATKKANLNSDWKSILKGPPSAPLCSGHGEVSVRRIVKKDGPNKGRSFYCCARPEGPAGNKEARCQFFVWIGNS